MSRRWSRIHPPVKSVSYRGPRYDHELPALELTTGQMVEVIPFDDKVGQEILRCVRLAGHGQGERRPTQG